MPRVSDLTEAEDQYLVSRHADFRQTPSNDKDAFREDCAKHIIAGRSLSADNEYILDLFTTKVRNWFQNNAPVKKTRLPLRINNDFHPERVWGMLHQREIREGLLTSRPAEVADDAPHVVLWNAKRKELWKELDGDEQAVYDRMAALWSEEGPDDDLKPQMAERRAVAWMKAVILLFWQQCRMPVFIYGCFEDTKAQLQGATFDTSLLFEATTEGKGKPTFRQSKEWATDFRAYFYNFFTPYIRPDLASPEAMEYLRTVSKKVVQPFEFETTDEGWPILPKGDDVSHTRRQEILRMWLKDLYSLAWGRETLAVPWSSLLKIPDKFFAPGMLPEGIHLNDPSHIRKQDLIDFYAHVQKIQSRPSDAPADLPHRFEFSHYEDGPETARVYPVAVNIVGNIEAWQPRRAKKNIRPPTFDAPPGATDSEDGESGDAAAKKASSSAPKRNARFNPGPKFYKDVRRIQRENERERAREAKVAAKAAKKAAKMAKKGKGRGKGKGKGKKTAESDEDPWVTDEEEESPEEEEEMDFEAMDNDVPEEDSEFSNEEQPSQRKSMLADDLADDSSGDEVEVELERYDEVLSSSAVRKNAPPSAGPSRLVGESASGRAGRRASSSRTSGVRGKAAIDQRATAPASDAYPALPESRPAPNAAADASDAADEAWTPPKGADISPKDVPPDGRSRSAYLKSLHEDPAYADMLTRVEELLTETSSIRVQPPLFWASWAYNSPFLPKDVHTGLKAQKTLDGVLKFLKKGPPKTYRAMEAQRYCLVMGIALHTIMSLQFIDPGDPWPKRLPEYMAASPVSFDMLPALLQACDAAFRGSPAPRGVEDSRAEMAEAPLTRDSHLRPSTTAGPSAGPSNSKASSNPKVAAKSAKHPSDADDHPAPDPASDTAHPLASTSTAASKPKAAAKRKAKRQPPPPADPPATTSDAPPAVNSRRRARGPSAPQPTEDGAEPGRGADASQPAPKPATRRSTRLRS